MNNMNFKDLWIKFEKFTTVIKLKKFEPHNYGHKFNNLLNNALFPCVLPRRPLSLSPFVFVFVSVSVSVCLCLSLSLSLSARLHSYAFVSFPHSCLNPSFFPFYISLDPFLVPCLFPLFSLLFSCPPPLLSVHLPRSVSSKDPNKSPGQVGRWFIRISVYEQICRCYERKYLALKTNFLS